MHIESIHALLREKISLLFQMTKNIKLNYDIYFIYVYMYICIYDILYTCIFEK